MTSQADLVQPPRLANWLINLFAAGEEADSLLGDLQEEFSQQAARSGVGFARNWYWRQTSGTIADLLGGAFRAAPGLITASVVGGLFLNRLVSGLPERGMFAILGRYQVYDHHFTAYLLLTTTGVKISHAITWMLLGCLVALAAKGKELAATLVLSFVLCAMTIAALLSVVATGRTPDPWMLPWYAADCLAIVVGGAIVRVRRSVGLPRPFAA